MTLLTHQQARQYILAAADELLHEPEQQALAEHLHSCSDCQNYQAELNALENRLQTAFQIQRETAPVPRRTHLPSIQNRQRRNMMNARLASITRLSISVALLTGLIVFVAISLTNIKDIKTTPTVQAGIQTVSPEPQVTPTQPEIDLSTGKQNGEWIAFIASLENTQSTITDMDVYLIHADGSKLTNLTNNPDDYYQLSWAPNGEKLAFLRQQTDQVSLLVADVKSKQITQITNLMTVGSDQYSHIPYQWSPDSRKLVFRDKHNDNYAIFAINADGSNLKLLTTLLGQETDPLWSPDGSQIAYLSYENTLDNGNFSIHIMNADGSHDSEVVHGTGQVKLHWSTDGKLIYATTDSRESQLECDSCLAGAAIYLIRTDDNSVRQIFHAPDSERIEQWSVNLYPQTDNSIYFSQINPSTHITKWMTTNGNTAQEVGTLDAHRICPSTQDGYLEDYASPNARFSLVSVPCQGTFNLYLTDHRVTSPEAFLQPLTTLPQIIKGLGKDSTWLPTIWSPDGNSVVMQAEGSGDYGTAVYLLDIKTALQNTTTQPTVIFQSKGTVFGIAWQPASKKQETLKPNLSARLLAFEWTQNANSDIYVMKTDGSAITNITNNPATDRNPIWSPDGKRIAFESDRNGKFDVFVMNADGSELVNISNDSAYDELGTTASGFNSPWSPDGHWLMFQSNRGGQDAAYVTKTDGSGQAIKFSDTPAFAFWSPDGKQILYAYNINDDQPDTIYIVNADGTQQRMIKANTFVQGLFWSPDGQYVFYRENDPTGKWDIQRIDVANSGEAETVVSVEPSLSPAMAWTGPDSTFIYTLEGSSVPTIHNLYRTDGKDSVQVAEIESSKVCGKETFASPNFAVSHDTQLAISYTKCDESIVLTAHDLTKATSVRLGELSNQPDEPYVTWSQDDRLVLVRTLQSDPTSSAYQTGLYLFYRDELFLASDTLTPIWDQPNGPVKMPALQPVHVSTLNKDRTPVAIDRLVAFTISQAGNAEIYALIPNGSEAINLTNNPAYDGNPVWSPDGKRMAFESERDGNREIYVLDLDGKLIRLTNDPANDILTSKQAWSPDGKHILYRNDHNGRWDLFAAQTDGSGVTQLTQNNDQVLDDFYWSPDGQQVAYLAGTVNHGEEIYVVNVDGSHRQQLPSPNAASNLQIYSWSTDGQSLYYRALVCADKTNGECGNLRPDLYRGALNGSKPLSLAVASENSNWAILPDGIIYIDDKRFPMASSNAGIDDWLWWKVTANDRIQLNEWSTMQEKCQSPDIDSVVIKYSRYVDWPGSPQYSLVSVYCGKDGNSWFYLVNEDGALIQPLIGEALPGEANWLEISADGKLGIVEMNDQTTYMLDLQNPAAYPAYFAVGNIRVQPVPFGGTVNLNQVTHLATSEPVNPTPSQTGDLIAFIRMGERDSDLYTMNKDGSGLKQLTHDPLASIFNPQWSPDGKKILFGAYENAIEGLYLIGADGSGLTQLVQDGWNAIWSPDGRKIAYLAGDAQNPEDGRIEIIDSEGQHLRTVRFNTVSGLFDLGLQWSSDGKFIQFATRSAPYSTEDLWTIYQASLQTGELQVLAQSQVPIVNWSGTNAANLAYMTHDESFSPKEDEWAWRHGQDVIATWYQAKVYPWIKSWWSPDKRKLLFTLNNGISQRLFLTTVNAPTPQEIAGYLTENFHTVSWSPDGGYIVFSDSLDSIGNQDVYLLDVKTALRDPNTRPIRITNSGFSEIDPVWQPAP